MRMRSMAAAPLAALVPSSAKSPFSYSQNRVAPLVHCMAPWSFALCGKKVVELRKHWPATSAQHRRQQCRYCDGAHASNYS